MGAAAILTILRNGETLKTHSVEGEAMLGRGEGCVIRLEDRAVSRQHALVRPVGDGLQIEKKNEFAPLIVNGAECTSAVLKEGDVISIGPYLVKVAITASKPVDLVDTAPVIETAPALSLVSMVAPSTEFSETSEAPAEAVASVALVAPMEESPMAELDPVPAMPVEERSALIDDDARTKLLSQTKVRLKLIFPPGAASVEELELDRDETSIGRGKNCDVVLNDKKSSRKHAIVHRSGLVFTIKDLESANGTFVNGVKVSEQELSGDDQIRIGDVDFRIQAVSADYAERAKEFLEVPSLEDSAALADVGNPVVEIDPNLIALQIPAADQHAPVPQTDSQPIQPQESPVALQTTPHFSSDIPGISGITGMTTGKKKSLFMDKFRALPKRTQYLVIVAVVAGMYIFLDEPVETPAKKAPKPKAGVVTTTGQTGSPTFESLTPQQQKFVEAQRQLAFEHYRNGDYDKALFEVRKIFQYIQEYNDAREIERYALEGKRKLDAREEEKRRKEEELRVNSKIAELTSELEGLMAKRHYEQAREIFAQVLTLDPDNAKVAEWKRIIAAAEEGERIAEQEKRVRDEVNKNAWETVAQGIALQKRGKHFGAMDAFGRVIAMSPTDERAVTRARRGIAVSERRIAEQRDPLLEEGRQAEEAGEFSKAYKLYQQAAKVDPRHKAGFSGMNRISGVLHEKAKLLYTEAVLAESYSDFDRAKVKYQECQAVAPTDDIYYERAKRKLSKYYVRGIAGE